MTTLGFLILLLLIGGASGQHTFRDLFMFKSGEISGNTFTSVGNNGYTITIPDQTSWVDVKATGARGNYGLLQIDHETDPTFPILANAAQQYNVILNMYFFQEEFDCVLFCTQINTTTPYILDDYVTWCVTVEQDATTFKVKSQLHDGTVVEEHEVSFTDNKSGWQYIRAHIQNNGGNTYHDFTAEVYDPANTNLFLAQTETGTTPPATADSNIYESLIGRKQNTTNSINVGQLSGVIFSIAICDASTDCGYTYSGRDDFLQQRALDFYDHFWDLTTGNTWNSTQVVNPCVRANEIDGSVVNFHSNDDDLPPFPTERGWFHFKKDDYLISDEINFGKSHQFTIELDLFPLDDDFEMEIFPWDTTSSAKRKHRRRFKLSKWWAGVLSTYSELGNTRLEEYKWNKLHLVYTISHLDGTVDIDVYHQVLQESGVGNTQSFTTDHTTGHRIDWGAKLDTNTIQIRLRSVKSIVKQIKFYKWAMNEQTIKDIGMYEYASDPEYYQFQEDFENKYMDKFDDEDMKINDATNACKTFVSSSTDVCMDLSKKDKESCPRGFDEKNKFCIDDCGDGSVQTSPQVYQCDDGNDKEGDGCDKKCRIEDEFSCVIKTNLNNKSYCTPKCGSGVFDLGNEECDDGNEEDGDGCNNDCTIPSGFKCDHIVGEPCFCYPNCGDGTRDTSPTTETCDDGNNMSFDGCSEDCQVEENYVCTQNASGVDECTTIYERPVPTFSSISDTYNSLIIEFDQNMLEQELGPDDIQLIITGPNSPYTVEYTTKFVKNRFIVDFTVSPAFIGGVNEQIQLQLLEIKSFKSEHSIPMSSAQVFDFVIPMFPVSESAESSGAGASYTFLVTMVISLGVSVLTGGSIELMWGLANTLQIMFFIGLVNLNYPSDLENTYKIMAYSNFDNPASEYITKYIFFSVDFIQSPISTKFESFGFGSTNIFANAFDKIAMVIAIMFFAVIMAILYYKCKDRDTKFAEKIEKFDKDFRYESITRFLIELALNLSAASLINIFYGQLEKAEDIAAFVISIITILGMFALMMYAYIYPIAFVEEIQETPEVCERHCLLFLQFKKDSIRPLLFYGHFMLRRLCIALVIVCMKEFVAYQLYLILYSCIFMFIYAANQRPYLDAKNNFLNIFNEAILVIYCVMLFLFLDDGNPNQLIRAGYACIGCIIVFFFVNWVVIFPVLFYNMYKDCRKKCSKEEKSLQVRRKKRDNSVSDRRKPIFEESKYDDIVIEKYKGPMVQPKKEDHFAKFEDAVKSVKRNQETPTFAQLAEIERRKGKQIEKLKVKKQVVHF